MAKAQRSQNAIVKGTKTTSLVSEEKQQAAVVLGYLEMFAAIDKREMTDQLRDTYVSAICNHKPPFSLSQIEKGLREYLETGTKWPWPGILVELIEEQI